MLHPQGMLNRKLRAILRSLSPNERTFVVDRLDTYGTTPFAMACAEGFTRVVKYMCHTCSPDLTKRHKWRNRTSNECRMAPALWIAAVSDHWSIVKVLLDAGADINAVSDTGSTPINSACFLGHEDMVNNLLNEGADINIPNAKGGTCLMNSVHHDKIFTKLLEEGANVYARDSFQKTAFHYAIEENAPSAVTCLLGNKANPLRVDSKECRELVISGALVSAGVFEALNPLLFLEGMVVFLEYFEIRACAEYYEGHPNFLDIWITVARSRLNLNISKPINKPIAHFENRSECVSEQQYRELRTDRYCLYETLMIYTRILGHTHEFVISALVNILEEHIETDRLMATRIGFLLFNLQIQKFGLLDESVVKTSDELMESCCELKRNGMEIDFEISFESLKIMREELEVNRAGVDQLPESKQKFYDWALNIIVILVYIIETSVKSREQEEDFLRYIRDTLLGRGCEEAQLCTVFSGYTLLHLVVYGGEFYETLDEPLILPNLTLVQLLLSCGAPVNAVSFDGSSPLFLAAAAVNYDKEIVELLLRYGAHHDQVGPGGDTAMEVLRRGLEHSNDNRQPPNTLPTVRSLQCHCALALTKAGVNIQGDAIPYGLRYFLKIHSEQNSRSPFETLVN